MHYIAEYGIHQEVLTEVELGTICTNVVPKAEDVVDRSACREDLFGTALDLSMNGCAKWRRGTEKIKNGL